MNTRKIFKYLFHRDHFIVTVSAFIQLLVLGFVAFNLDFLNPIAEALASFSITDVFFDIQHSGETSETCDLVTLVDMTELHNRGDIALLLENIKQENPLCIGVDLIFEGEKDDRIGNELLEDTVAGMTEQTVFSRKLTDYDSRQGTFTNDVRSYFADRIDITEAYTNLNDNMAGATIRNFSIAQTLHGEQVLSFPAKIASFFDETVSCRDDEDLLINYRNVTFPIVAYNEIEEKRDLIEGHIVLVGTMTEEQDMHNTPLGKTAGLEVQAYSLLTLLEHKGIKSISPWMTWIIAFLICYLLELSIDIVSQFVNKQKKSVFMVFIKESNIVAIVMLFLWITFVCWLMFVMFVKHNITLSGGIILGLMALVCEGRDLLKSVVKAIGAKYGKKKFVLNSILRDDD